MSLNSKNYFLVELYSVDLKFNYFKEDSWSKLHSNYYENKIQV